MLGSTFGWVVFRRDRIHEFRDRTSFGGSGLVVSLGCGLPRSAEGLGLLVLIYSWSVPH